VWSSERRSERR